MMVQGFYTSSENNLERQNFFVDAVEVSHCSGP